MSQDNKARKEADDDFATIYLPLITNSLGEVDLAKVKAEMTDLIFVANQVAKVYCAVTGGRLSKLMYYAETIIAEYEDQLSKAYDEGYQDALKEHNISNK